MDQLSLVGRARPRAGCTTHCRSCGSHFSSEGAFDAHRQFEPGHAGDWDRRICLDPRDVRHRDGRARLAPRTEDGHCRIAKPYRERDVVVWTMAAAMDPAEAERLAGVHERAA